MPEAKGTALITGAASGIGRAIAKRLAAAGHRVVLTDLDLAGATELAQSLGENASALQLDITDRARVDDLPNLVPPAFRPIDLAQVAQIVKKNLSLVWAATKDPQLRKQALFEMWDECVETGSAEVVEAASTARKMIIGFIRANFPAHGPHPYTAAEIAACNRAKQSTATFSPYE